jgi:hypothetical protein
MSNGTVCLCVVLRADANDQLVLVNAAGHVALDHKSDATEHLFLDQPRLLVQRLSNPFRQTFFISHMILLQTLQLFCLPACSTGRNRNVDHTLLMEACVTGLNLISAPIVNGDAIHKRKVPIICQEDQIVNPCRGCDLSI